MLLQTEIVVETIKAPGWFVQVSLFRQTKGSAFAEIVAETIKAPGCFVQISLSLYTREKNVECFYRLRSLLKLSKLLAVMCKFLYSDKPMAVLLQT